MKTTRKPKEEFLAISGNRLAWIQFDKDPNMGDAGLLIGHNEESPVYLYSLSHLRRFHHWIGQYIAYLEARKGTKR